MLKIKSDFLKHTVLITFILFQLIITQNSYARNVVLRGDILNPSSSEVGSVMRVYIPGSPYFDGNTLTWSFLTELTYDKVTGRYDATADIPNGIDQIVLSVAYLPLEVDIMKLVNVNTNNEVIANISLPATKNSSLSFKINILVSGISFDFINNSASCLIVNKDSNTDGRLMLMSVYDAWLHKFTAYGFPDGQYRMACSVQNTTGVTVNGVAPGVLKRYKDFTLPLSSTDKTINFDFSQISTDGAPY